MDPQRETNAIAAMSATRERFAAAVRRGDAGEAGAVYAANATLLPPSAELVTGRTAIERFWQAGIDAGIADVELEPLTASSNGRLAYEVGSYSLELHADGGRTVVERGKYVRVHEQQGDGSWHWAVEMFSPESPPARPTRAPSDPPKEEP